jgi:hypothetical protein
MTDHTDADTVLLVTSARDGGKYLAAGEMSTAGHAHTTSLEALPSPDLRPPGGDQAPDAGPGVDALLAPDPVYCGKSW